MRLTHYQVYGEPVIRAVNLVGFTGYYVLCACGARVPDGDGFMLDMATAAERARVHEQELAFDVGWFAEPKSVLCRDLLRLSRDKVLRVAVIGRLASETAEVRGTVAVLCERAMVAEVWRGPWYVDELDAASIEHVLGVLAATAFDA